MCKKLWFLCPRNNFLPSAKKLRQGNIFTSVCQEFCPQGVGCLFSACWDTHPPGRHPPWQTSPRANTPSLPWAGTPLGRPPGQTPPCPVHARIDMATATDSKHPTGMHSCCTCFYGKIFICSALEYTQGEHLYGIYSIVSFWKTHCPFWSKDKLNPLNLWKAYSHRGYTKTLY